MHPEYKPFSKEFAGQTLKFRGNLLEADKVPVYPNETAIKDVLLGPNIRRINIAYVANDSENAFYLVSSFEFAFKTVIVYKYYFQGAGDVIVNQTEDPKETCLHFTEANRTLCIQSVALNNKNGIITNDYEATVLLLGPSQTNETSINVQGNLITASGKSFEENGRTYTDLDLAVDKILLVLMS